MLEILKYIFSDLWYFVGALILLVACFNLLIVIFKYITIMIKGYPENYNENDVKDEFLGL